MLSSPVAQGVAWRTPMQQCAYGGWFAPCACHSMKMTYRPSAALQLLGSLRISHNKFLPANKWIFILILLIVGERKQWYLWNWSAWHSFVVVSPGCSDGMGGCSYMDSYDSCDLLEQCPICRCGGFECVMITDAATATTTLTPALLGFTALLTKYLMG